MQTIICSAQELTETLPGMNLATAEGLLYQAEKYSSGESDSSARFIATSRTDFGELLHEAMWLITFNPAEGTYTITRVINFDEGNDNA